MRFKLEGFDEFERKLKQIEHGLDELSETKEVGFDELFTNDFMRSYTDFVSMQQMLEESEFTIKCPEDFKAIPDDDWDRYVNKCTKFESWSDMLKAAAAEYTKKKLGF